MTYCDYLLTLSGEKLRLHREYHDNHYGFPVDDNNRLFERMMFEINQAGLNWLIILKKQDSFRKAFDNYDINKVASYNEKDVRRLMNDKGIIRNRRKIDAAIENARIILTISSEFGSFKKWLDTQSTNVNTLDEWTLIFEKTFKFMGHEIVNEFLTSTGYLRGAHKPECPINKHIEDIVIKSRLK
jgi:DNA-3-methyladenine glycosylase I